MDAWGNSVSVLVAVDETITVILWGFYSFFSMPKPQKRFYGRTEHFLHILCRLGPEKVPANQEPAVVVHKADQVYPVLALQHECHDVGLP